jgi:membrane protein
VDFINLAILFAATVLLCFVPFLIVGNALAGRSTVHTLARHAGLSEQAAADFNHLIAPSATTFHAVAGTASVVLFVLGGIAAATALQQVYERVFGLGSRGLKDVWRRLLWLAWLLVAGVAERLGGTADPACRRAGAARDRQRGPVYRLLVVAGIVWQDRGLSFDAAFRRIRRAR